MKMKAMLTSLSLLAVLSTSSSIFAQPSATIPATMKPGTIITFDENNQMIVQEYEFKERKTTQVSSGLTEEQKKKLDEEEKVILEKVKKEAQSLPVFYLGEPELPDPQPGMTVYYDGMGLPTKIVDAEGKVVPTPSKIIKVENADGFSIDHVISAWEPPGNGVYIYGKDNNKLTITDSYVMGEGWVTWYDGVGKIGADNKKLTNDNCATKMDYDRPPYNTEIRVRNLSNDIVKNVYKADIGSLPNSVLDIMPDKMNDDFDSPVDKKKGLGRFNGRTYYEK